MAMNLPGAESEAPEEESDLPLPMPPGQPDTAMENMEVLSGLRRSPGPMTTGAGNNHLIQALNSTLVATQLDPGAAARLQPYLKELIDIVSGSNGLMSGPIGPNPTGGDSGIAGSLMSALGGPG